jgi:hypothetical protein
VEQQTGLDCRARKRRRTRVQGGEDGYAGVTRTCCRGEEEEDLGGAARRIGCKSQMVDDRVPQGHNTTMAAYM